jgi:hypothetical protein
MALEEIVLNSQLVYLINLRSYINFEVEVRSLIFNEVEKDNQIVELNSLIKLE